MAKVASRGCGAPGTCSAPATSIPDFAKLAPEYFGVEKRLLPKDL